VISVDFALFTIEVVPGICMPTTIHATYCGKKTEYEVGVKVLWTI
jgi:hypothetical protein